MIDLRWWVLVAGSLLVACVDSATVACEDGTVCPDGRVCATVPAVEGSRSVCVQPAQLAQCEGLADGAPCGPARSTCHGGACLPDACGNGLRDATEACDDGNVIAGDGCASDCRSAEVCGNGVLDPVRLVEGVVMPNERCDDGGFLSHDGCTSRCEVETPRWSELTFAQPTPRSRHGLVFDALRNELVMLGGANVPGTELDETSTWNGLGWARPGLVISPGPRVSPAMAYDQERGQTVLFGGTDLSYSVPYADTWTWDGAQWVEALVEVDQAPSERYEAAMAFDRVRDVAVLFGGLAGAIGATSDTWAWDGTRWTEVTPGVPMTSPPARSAHAMAWDPVRGVVVLFGGFGATNQALNDTWLWDGTAWVLASPAMAPAARAGAAMAWDTIGQQIIMFGGEPSRGAGPLGDAWAWDGAGWAPLAAGPPARAFAAMAVDGLQGGSVLHGGAATTFTALGDTWRWDGASWSNVTSSASPILHQTTVAADADRRRVVAFGGRSGTLLTNATLELVDDRWIDRTPTGVRPAARERARMAYDQARKETILWGGVDDGTWAWNGTSWRQVAPAAALPARTSAAMAYDAERQEVVLFGGLRLGSDRAETWIWDGATWTQRTPPTSPAPRNAAALGYDPIARRIVLFGGQQFPSGTTLRDLWTWDGTTWTELPQGLRPAARSFAELVWSAPRQRLVLVGGAGLGGDFQDAWELDGATWSRLDTAPPPRRSFAAYVAVPNGVLRLGGQDEAFVARHDGWRLRWDSAQPREVCSGLVDLDGDGRVGCTDPDCWSVCRPRCPPGVACDPSGPGCGDGTCTTEVETCRLCPADCGACPSRCGDLVCDGGETAATCPGDC